MDSNNQTDELLNKFFNDPEIARLRDLLIDQINKKNKVGRDRHPTNPILKQIKERHNPIEITIDGDTYNRKEIFRIVDGYDKLERQVILRKIIEYEYHVDVTNYTIELVKEWSDNSRCLSYY